MYTADCLTKLHPDAKRKKKKNETNYAGRGPNKQNKNVSFHGAFALRCSIKFYPHTIAAFRCFDALVHKRHTQVGKPNANRKHKKRLMNGEVGSI